MRKILPTLLGLLLTLPFMLTAWGGDYSNGFQEDGYTYRDGFWYLDTVPYVREKIVTPGAYYYDSCGRRFQGAGTYYWKYLRVPVAPYPVATTAPYLPPPVPKYSPDWKKAVMDYATARDDQQAFAGALAALGIQGQSFPFQNASVYGGGGLNTLGSPNLGSFGANGNSAYGYSYSSLLEKYGGPDMNVALQQAGRNTQAALQLGQQANTEFNSSVNLAGSNAARVAEYLAKAELARSLGAAASIPGSSRSITRGQGTGVTPTMPPAVDSTVNAAAFLKNTGIPLCGSCHSGATPQGGFDINQYPLLDFEAKEVVWQRLRTKDDTKRMPRDAGGKAGTPVTSAQYQEFVKN